MFSLADGELLLKEPKFMKDDNGFISEYSLTDGFPIIRKFTLYSEDEEFCFLYDIKQSDKNRLKISLYLMENESKYGLARIDYNGVHKNPDIIIESLPQMLHQYAGKWFDYSEPHMHILTQGYKSDLDWAIPLSECSNKVKEINDSTDIVDAVLEFNAIINLQTKFKLPGNIF